jgi:hypothetical protein
MDGSRFGFASGRRRRVPTGNVSTAPAASEYAGRLRRGSRTPGMRAPPPAWRTPSKRIRSRPGRIHRRRAGRPCARRLGVAPYAKGDDLDETRFGPCPKAGCRRTTPRARTRPASRSTPAGTSPAARWSWTCAPSGPTASRLPCSSPSACGRSTASRAWCAAPATTASRSWPARAWEVGNRPVTIIGVDDLDATDLADLAAPSERAEAA